MQNKCPVCYAPFDGNKCGSCGYTKEPSNSNGHISFTSGTNTNYTGYASNTNGSSYANNTGYGSNTNAGNANVGSTPNSPKNMITVLLLCFFLGTLGVHRFYVGKIGTGILYLLTLGILGIGIVYDLILICTNSFKDSNGLPIVL